MALIGKMNYLTIGGNTYEIEDANAAPLASPQFTGTPTAPTAASGDSSTQIATTAFVQEAMSGAGAGTVTSVGVQNATNGGLSVSGSPISSSGTITIGHSNVLTSAQTTQAVYPITIDKNGHISAYGSAVTIPDEQLYCVEMGGTVNWSELAQAVNAGKYVVGKYYDSTSGTYYAYLPEQIQITNTSSPGTSDYITFTPSISSTGPTGVFTAQVSWDGNGGWHETSGAFYGKVWYGTSSTTASTAAKVVTCSEYTLQTGSIIGISFSTANTAATPTLNINSTGTKSIYVGASTPNATDNVLKWSANTMVYFLYDGTYFRYITSVSAGTVAPSRGANTWYGTSSTGATTQAKTSTIDNFVLTKGAVVYITFSTANTYSSAKITLNINSTGAKDVYYNNAVTSSTNTLLWNAGETLIFIYSGSYYYYAGKSITKTSQLTNDSGFITSVPSATQSATTGISIADHSTTTVTGVSGSTNIYGVQSSTTTASHVKSGGNGTAPSLGTAFTIPNVTAAGSGSFSATVSSSHVLSFSHVHTAPTLGTAFTVPNVTSAGSASNWVFEDITVPIKNSSTTSVPTAASSATTVVTSATHSVTDGGHAHTI